MKNIILLLSFVLFGATAQAQLFDGLRYGAKIGATHNNVTELHHDSKPRIAGNIGGFVNLPLTQEETFMFQPEIVVSWQGEYYDRTGTGDPLDKYFLTYVNVPLMFKGYFSDRENDFFALLGPYVGFKVSETFEPASGEGPMQPGYDYVNNQYEDFDFGFGAGVGYSFARQYEVDLRVSYGLVDLVSNDVERLDNRNGVFAVNFNYIFD
ncbi:MAG: hypothetical protein C4K58_02610 [Flavobacteriaceae bacterium]|nr:MAG: hypothetical protein C4K58_02610 [Flavobacteriaceae bacterium]